MRLSTKGRYAVTAMLELAIRHGQGAVHVSGPPRPELLARSLLAWRLHIATTLGRSAARTNGFIGNRACLY